MQPFDQLRIAQLTSTYAPDRPPSLPLEFGDYLSILWRLDHATKAGQIQYYRRCEQVLSQALGLSDLPLGKLVRQAQPGTLYETLGYLPYRMGPRVLDAADRRAATDQLLNIRSDVLRLAAYEEKWGARWPGGALHDSELRERVFAVLFTALPSQLLPFARMLLVIDIVLEELLTGTREHPSLLLHTLVTRHGYPDPQQPETIELFAQEA